MTAEPNLRCPKCGYEMWAGELKHPPGIECSMTWFCPVDHHAMVAKDVLGEIEAAHQGDDATFEEFVKQPHVLGTIHAEIPDDDSESGVRS